MTQFPPKIKVCHLASGDLWAGAEVQVVNACRGLAETGAVEVRAVLLNNGRLADELRSLGIEVSVINEQTTAWWQILWQLARHFRRQPVDILHAHRYKENILGSLAARMSGVPHVLRTIHGTTEIYSGWKWINAQIYEAVDHLVCRFCVSRLIAVSREISEELERQYPGKPVTHIPNCIDERRMIITKERNEKRAELGLKPSEFVIGTIGRLAPVKGIEYLIRAVPEIVKRHEDVRVLVVGDGPSRTGLEALVRSLGLEKTVTFLGWRHDTTEIMNALDLFILPSLHEGTPTALLEAMCLGIPVVASATGGVRDLIIHGENGLLVEPKDVHGLAATCSAVMEDASLRQRLTSNCLRSISGKYRVATVTEAHLSHYYRLLAWRDDGHSPK